MPTVFVSAAVISVGHGVVSKSPFWVTSYLAALLSSLFTHRENDDSANREPSHQLSREPSSATARKNLELTPRLRALQF